MAYLFSAKHQEVSWKMGNPKWLGFTRENPVFINQPHKTCSHLCCWGSGWKGMEVKNEEDRFSRNQEPKYTPISEVDFDCKGLFIFFLLHVNIKQNKTVFLLLSFFISSYLPLVAKERKWQDINAVFWHFFLQESNTVEAINAFFFKYKWQTLQTPGPILSVSWLLSHQWRPVHQF